MIEIKPAGIESIETIRRLAHEIWPVAYGSILSAEQLEYMLEKFYSISSLQHQISDLHHQFLLVFKNEKAVGFASFSPHDESPTIFHLNKIYVLPGQQGQSIGNQLLDFVINEIRKSGGVALQLNVNRNNKALHFYEKHGFAIIREEDIDIGNGYFMNDYVMEKKMHL
jgi:ribosomal protein S18 acetylase RimI-like enzyme